RITDTSDEPAAKKRSLLSESRTSKSQQPMCLQTLSENERSNKARRNLRSTCTFGRFATKCRGRDRERKTPLSPARRWKRRRFFPRHSKLARSAAKKCGA